MGKGKQTDEQVDFGLPDPGAFSDPHDSQRQDAFGDRKSSISTQDDFAVADVLKQSLTAGNTLSFEPTTSDSEPVAANTGDQSTAKTVANEQS